MSPHEMQRGGNRVGVDDGMCSIAVRKRDSNEDWLAPKPIPSDLARVEAFALELLPDRLAPWIDDIATRLQCPPDYPAITAMTALGAILGRKIAIKPQMKTDWIEIPNIWGVFIGPPGMLKSLARIAEYVKRANSNANGGDGLLQRFGLMAWPDTCPEWKDMDRYPHSRAREDAWDIFERLSKLDRRAAIALGARRGPADSVPFFRLSAAAHDAFLSWRSDLERRLRTGKMAPALEAHLAKYRKLVPALALINHLVDNGQNEISPKAMGKALAFSNYLETHARRLYGATSEPERAAAQAILAKIHEGELHNGFTAREVHQHDWSFLTDRDQVQAGLNLLVELHYLAASSAAASERGGRPTTTYTVNPRGWHNGYRAA